MNERQLVADVLAVFKSHIDDPFLMGQIARAEDDLDLERPIPDLRHDADRLAEAVADRAFVLASVNDGALVNRRHIRDAVLAELADLSSSARAADQIIEFAERYCPPLAQWQRDALRRVWGAPGPVVGTFHGTPVVVSDEVPNNEVRFVYSEAHDLDQPADERDITVWSYRMVSRDQYAITRDGTDVAEILFHQRMPGVAAVVPKVAETLADSNSGRFVDPRTTPRSQQ